MILLLLLGIVFIVAATSAALDIAHDGYRPVQTRSEGQETLPRYR